jgi:hypothetical protein
MAFACGADQGAYQCITRVPCVCELEIQAVQAVLLLSSLLTPVLYEAPPCCCHPDADTAQNITIMVTANASGSCSSAKQQQLTAAVLQEVTARTPQEHAGDIQVSDAVCSTSDSRRRAAKPRDLVSTYTVLANTVAQLDSFSTLQASLQQTVGSTMGEPSGLTQLCNEHWLKPRPTLLHDTE